MSVRSSVRPGKAAPPPIQTVLTSSNVPFLTGAPYHVSFSSIYLSAENAIFFTMTFIKVCMWPLYRSTDFEVHRNWLAITNSLPLNEWYTESRSEWTLDYPPLFAWFEWFLSQFAAYIDPKMLDVDNLYYASTATILFQRATVILSDIVLFYAIHTFARARAPWLPKDHSHSRITLLTLAFCSPALLIVDHIHFQYNGFLFGIFILSIAAINSNRDLLGGFLFALLLNFKHIYLYCAPAYIVYLFMHYCFEWEGEKYEKLEEFDKSKSRGKLVFKFGKLVKLGLVVSLVFLVSFGPFVLLGQLIQLKDRLFPFKRGLSHAYWAPNVWALYNVADIGLTKVLTRLFHMELSGPSLTAGLVADLTHTVLPTIAPYSTAVLTILSMCPILLRLYCHPHPSLFMPSLIYCSLCSFMLGWHVHEKALLIPLIPLSLLACDSLSNTKLFYFLSYLTTYTQFPLLFQVTEAPIKVILLILYHLLAYSILNEYWYEEMQKRRIRYQGILSNLELLYLSGLIPLYLYTELLHKWIAPQLEFFPLLLTSVYCSIGTVYSWWLCWESHSTRVKMLESYEQE